MQKRSPLGSTVCVLRTSHPTPHIRCNSGRKRMCPGLPCSRSNHLQEQGAMLIYNQCLVPVEDCKERSEIVFTERDSPYKTESIVETTDNVMVEDVDFNSPIVMKYNRIADPTSDISCGTHIRSTAVRKESWVTLKHSRLGSTAVQGLHSSRDTCQRICPQSMYVKAPTPALPPLACRSAPSSFRRPQKNLLLSSRAYRQQPPRGKDSRRLPACDAARRADSTGRPASK